MLILLMFLLSFQLKHIVASCNRTFENSPSYRLSNILRPEHYELDLNIKSFDQDYEGHVNITFGVTDGCAAPLEIHASKKYIHLTDWKIESLGDEKADFICNITGWNSETDILKFQCNLNFKVDRKYLLSIQYTSKFTTDDMDGFYKSTYTEDGESQVLLATQFEPTHARRAFPCFDEPQFKAMFSISMKYPKEYAALGNMPGTTVAADSNYKRTTFQTTPVLSTYLVALIVSKFEYALPTSPSQKYDYRVYARKSAKNEMAIATEYGTKLLDTMGRWIGKPYETLGDTQAYQVAIPDFAAGAMENMGLITYREVSLLDEGNATSNAAKQRIITVIAHEFSHQWFGDYATTDWWSDLWLNEGFATYFEHHLPSKVLGFEEDYELEKQFLTTIQIALKTDAETTAQPLSDKMSSINSEVQINQKFDELTYSKGGSIVRMMSYILGLENFQAGLRSYINDHHEINKNPENLLQHLQQAAPANELMKNFNKHMHNWIYTPGFPLVEVALQNDNLILTQERFNHDRHFDGKWSIPISYASAQNPSFNFTLVEWMEGETKFKYKGGWIIFNVQAIGFYRVNYDDFLWDKIIEALKDKHFEKIDVLNRAQLIDDIYSIAKIGKVGYEKAFQLTDYLKTEKDYYPWVSAFTAFEFLLKKLEDPAKKALQTLILGYINQAFNKNDKEVFKGHIGVIKEVLIMSWSCKLGQQECISYAKKEFEGYKKNPNAIDRNFRSVILCYGLKHSENLSEDYNTLFSIFKKSDSSIEQTSILEALGCMNDEKLIKRYLFETIRKDSPIRQQDAAMVFASVYTNSDIGLDTALHFLQQHFSEVEAAYKGLNSISRIIIGMAEDVSNDDQRRQLSDILREHSHNAEITLIKDRATKIMEENRRWNDQYASSIQNAIDKLSNSAAYLAPMPVLLITLVLVVELLRIVNKT